MSQSSTTTMLQKIYECLDKNCKAQIKLERRPDGGWNKYNASDGSPHIHPRKGQQQQQQQQPEQLSEGPQIAAALSDEIIELRAQVKILISQVQTMRSEFKELKAELQNKK